MLAFVLLIAAQTTAFETVDRMAGEYRHAGGPEDRCSIEAAIERAVELMFWPASDIARSRLRETNPIPRRVMIRRAGANVQISFDGRLRETALHSRPVVVIGLSGDEVRYRLEVESGALVQRFDGDAGGRLNTIRLEGDLLIVRVVVFSQSLPVNVTYDLRYARVR
jgi:hypothetical protein